MNPEYRTVLRDMAKLWVDAGGTAESIRYALVEMEQYVAEEQNYANKVEKE